MDTQKQTGPRRYLKLALALSLGLNLLFVGVFAGAAYRQGSTHGHAGPRLQSYAAPYIKALPRQQRRSLHDMLRAEGAMPDRKMRRALYQQMLAGLRADPFDAAAVEMVLSDQAQAARAAIGASQAAWLKVVSEMSAQERTAYADALEERLKRGPRKRGQRKKHSD